MKRTALHLGMKNLAQGSSLIEVLVSILILSIGLLAMAGIHATSLRDGKTNQFKVAAGEIAVMLGDAIKVNPDAQISGAAAAEKIETTGGYVIGTVGVSSITAPSNQCGNVAVACAPADIAALDVYNARLSAQTNLPSGDIYTEIVSTATSSPSLAIWVYWVKPNADNNDKATDQSLWDTTRDQCPPKIQALTPARQCLMQLIPL